MGREGAGLKMKSHGLKAVKCTKVSKFVKIECELV